MISVPFLDIPFVAQEMIIKNISSDDVVLLVLTSTRMQKAIKNCGIKLEKALWAIENNSLRIRMHFKLPRDRLWSDVLVKHCDETQWNHEYLCFVDQELGKGNLRHNTITSQTLYIMTTAHHNGRPLSIQTIHNFCVFGYRMENFGQNTGYIIYTRDVIGEITSQEMTCAIIQDLLDTFVFEKNNLLASDLSSPNLPDYFDLFPKFDCVEIKAENISCFDKIQDLFKVEGSFISVQKAQWVTIDWLKDMRCREIDLTGDNLSSKDLNTFIKHWLEGGYSKLQEVVVHRIRNNLDVDIILKDIHATVWNGQARPNNYRFPNDPGMDIRRSDGKLASVFLGPIKFVFKVWP